jgi:hypothetical protein
MYPMEPIAKLLQRHTGFKPLSSILKYFWTAAQGRGDEVAEFCNWLDDQKLKNGS